ncbi:MAG: hypothetical protein HYY49_08255 [Ignavibacteriales bacterium]|nr:hypothetical protein [Ignavibacteriales bacterium]
MKHTKIRIIGYILAAALVSLSGCTDLEVTNPNQPTRATAITQAGDIESLIAGSFLTWWTGTQKDADFPALTISTMADAHTSSWGNWGMQDLSSEARIAYNNSSLYGYAGVNRDTWIFMYRANANANDGLQAINKGLVITNANVTRRAKAFAKFIQGISHAWIASFFDQGYIIDETQVIDENFKPAFQPYGPIMTFALAMLDSAEALCNQGSFGTGNDIPGTWIKGVTLSNTQFAAVIRSFRARFRASVARTPADRQSVDWTKVIADAQNSIVTDAAKEWGPTGDGNFWWDGLKFRGQHTTWTRGDYKTIGLADTAGNYTAWLATPVQQRNVFTIKTPDRRITGNPAGTTTGTYFAAPASSQFRDDRGTYHHSLYRHKRFEYHLNQGATGLMTFFTKPEMDLLEAEGLWYANPVANRAAVVALINKTRVTNGQWAPLTVGDSDADIWKWLKYEKMIETFATGSGIPWFDRRGWGELVSGTLINFPVPGRELEAREMPLYTLGGEGQAGGAPKALSLGRLTHPRLQ